MADAGAGAAGAAGGGAGGGGEVLVDANDEDRADGYALMIEWTLSPEPEPVSVR